MTTTSSQQTILITGGTGKTGRRVTDRLATHPVTVRSASRSGPVPFDWERSATWAPALDGVDRVYLTYAPDLAFSGAAERIADFATLARESGTHRIVLLSGRGEVGAAISERGVTEADLEWTVLRCSFFAQNFSEHFLVEPVLSGEIAFPAGDVAEPFIDLEDVADMATLALLEDGHSGRTYELTGPRLVTFAEAVAEISTITGRPIAYTPVTAADYRKGLLEYGVPAELAAELTALFAEVLDGHNSYLTGDVEALLGRAPTDFRDVVRRAAESGAWDLAASTGGRPE